VLVSSGWTSLGVSDKRLIIDVDENRMGTVLVDESFLSRTEMTNYTRDDNDTVTIRCRIQVFDNEEMEGIVPHPTPIPGIHRWDEDDDDGVDARRKPANSRKIRHSTTVSAPAKRRRLQ